MAFSHCVAPSIPGCSLFRDPSVEIDAPNPPLTAHFERWQLAVLRHRIDRLFRELQDRGTVFDGQNLVFAHRYPTYVPSRHQTVMNAT